MNNSVYFLPNLPWSQRFFPLRNLDFVCICLTSIPSSIGLKGTLYFLNNHTNSLKALSFTSISTISDISSITAGCLGLALQSITNSASLSDMGGTVTISHKDFKPGKFRGGYLFILIFFNLSPSSLFSRHPKSNSNRSYKLSW